MYISALLKAKKATSIYESDKAPSYEFQFTFYQAVKAYESSIYSLIESRQIVRDTIKKEIDKLVQQREHEEATRKTYKTKLAEANSNYTNYRNRDIVKLQKLYTHKCEDLKNAQTTYQAQQLQIQQQQLHANEESNDDHKLSRNSLEASRLSGEYGSIKDLDGNSDQHNKKGMAGLFSQMRTIASSGGSYLSSVDQNKQISKFAKMKKDIAEADSEYRDGILILEALRKKQRKAVEETNWQVKNTIKRKTEGIKSSLLAIIMAEMESLRIETEKSTASYAATMSIDSAKDIQTYTMHYQSLGYSLPAPIRYENYYLEGKCREVLFGGSLESYAIEHNRPVPVIVEKCIDAIEAMGGLQKEGIYRVSGRQTNIEQLKHQFELDEDKVVLDSKYDVFTIATVLKMYIRELKRPLFDFNVQSRLTYSKNMPQAQRFGLLEMKLANLSLAHRRTLHRLICHLSNVNSNNHINKMNIQNLSLIFTPVIFHDFNQADETTAGDWSPEDLFEDLILYHEVLFPVAEENARKLNEPKLQKALKGESPYSQFSQSNLLYISNPPTATVPVTTPKNMLLTQPMSPPILSSDPSGNKYPESTNNNHYPPKLTTIIGTSPATYQQRLASLSSIDPQAHQSQQQFVPNYPNRPQMVDLKDRPVVPRIPSNLSQSHVLEGDNSSTMNFTEKNNSATQNQMVPADSAKQGSGALEKGTLTNDQQQQYQNDLASTPNRSSSDVVILQRGSSLLGKNPRDSVITHVPQVPRAQTNPDASIPVVQYHSSDPPLQQTPTFMPPRRDSLSTVKTKEKMEKASLSSSLNTTMTTAYYPQYQPELNMEQLLPTVNEGTATKPSPAQSEPTDQKQQN
ncbi:RhoGAP-domain-containing protein [Rhizopus microsporus]|nr:RhoGAP-domain-containing protein [Rhizopus microsporus]